MATKSKVVLLGGPRHLEILENVIVEYIQEGDVRYNLFPIFGTAEDKLWIGIDTKQYLHPNDAIWKELIEPAKKQEETSAIEPKDDDELSFDPFWVAAGVFVLLIIALLT